MHFMLKQDTKVLFQQNKTLNKTKGLNQGNMEWDYKKKSGMDLLVQ